MTEVLLMANVLSRLSDKAKDKILGALKDRIERAIQSNEDLRWDNLLSTIDGYLNIFTGKSYRGFINSLMLAFTSMECDGDPRFLTYVQMRNLSKGKGRIKKGKFMTPIWAPMVSKIVEEDDKGEEREKSILTGYRVAYVANVRQTNLIDLRLVADRWGENANKDSNPIEAVVDFVSGIEFKQTESHGSPYYCPSSDEIGIPPFEMFHDDFGHAEALCHELVHWTGAPGRLNRFEVGWSNRTEYSREELVACLGSTFLLAHLGVDLSESRIDRQSAYLKAWLRRLSDDTGMLLEAASEAGQSVNYLIRIANGDKAAEAA